MARRQVRVVFLDGPDEERRRALKSVGLNIGRLRALVLWPYD
jgi:hypothetical protein